MLRKDPFVENEYYHLYNRGVDKRTIFLNPHDYNRFLSLLYACNSSNKVDLRSHFREGRSFAEIFEVIREKQLVDILSYCLMPNHFHVLLTPREEGGVTTFMKKLSTGYSMYFNTKYKRTGQLFEGRFKSSRIDNDPYFLYIFSYIHLNPVKLAEPKWKEAGIADAEKAKQYLFSYAYSSLPDYVGTRKDSRFEKILARETAPDFLADNSSYERAIDSFFNYNQENVEK